MEKEKRSTWAVLSKIDCSQNVEKKNNLTYLSWAWAWGIVKENFPDASYIVREFEGKPYLHDSELGYMVQTLVTIGGETLSMMLPVMDNRNNAMKEKAYSYIVSNPKLKYASKGDDGVYRDKYGNIVEPTQEIVVEAATMFDINTAIMRCLTKNLAMFGLGHYIYAGEDLPKEYVNVSEKEKAIDDFIEKLKECKCTDDVNRLYDVFQYKKEVYNACVIRGKELRDA